MTYTHYSEHHRRRIIRLPEVIARVGLGKSTIYKLISEDKFPTGIQLGPRARGWDELEIDQWIESKLMEVA